MSAEAANPVPAHGEPQRTDVLTFVVKAVTVLPQLLVPLGFASYSIADGEFGSVALYLALLAAGALSLILLSSFLQWSRFTYRIGEADIRVESGVLSRAARSVPYERIQDVSLEQKLVPRLLGLVAVRFETGAGGKDELSLAYLSEEQGEALRELVRERREDSDEVPAGDPAGADTETASAPATTLFAMGPRRLFTFGLFEFSLAVVAVIGGLAQQFEFLLPFDIWDWREWSGLVAIPTAQIAEWGFAAQVVGGVLAVGSLLLLGVVTGIIRTFLRDWDFRLEKTAKGFRRRRGLLTRTDVVMPAHRVQALIMSTGLVRRRFGWNGLKFVSLAQDSGSSSHVVAPFAQDQELAPIIKAAGFEPARSDLDWQRASIAHRNLSMIINGFILGLATCGVLALTTLTDSDTLSGKEWFALIPFAVGTFLVAREFYVWRYARNALSLRQVFRRTGWLAPSTMIANRVKLQSVEIKQGPLGRWFGYASLHLGLAGGTYSIEGIPVGRARALRSGILDSIAGTDFSELNR